MHAFTVSLTCFMMILAPCMVAMASRMDSDELDWPIRCKRGPET